MVAMFIYHSPARRKERPPIITFSLFAMPPLAGKATGNNMSSAPPYLSGSDAVTPNSIPFTNRIAAHETSSPSANPAAIRRSVCQRIAPATPPRKLPQNSGRSRRMSQQRSRSERISAAERMRHYALTFPPDRSRDKARLILDAARARNGWRVILAGD